jgi:hypothetical protein
MDRFTWRNTPDYSAAELVILNEWFEEARKAAPDEPADVTADMTLIAYDLHVLKRQEMP